MEDWGFYTYIYNLHFYHVSNEQKSCKTQQLKQRLISKTSSVPLKISHSTLDKSLPICML